MTASLAAPEGFHLLRSAALLAAPGQLTYDPDLDMLFYGSSGVGPASETQRNMPGATMAGTDTRFGVKPKTGEVVWRHQVLPRDNWDQECTFEMMVINTPVNPEASAAGMLSINPDAKRGPRKTLTGIPCKTGIAWSFDAANGEFLWAKQTVEQNLVEKIDPKGLVTVNEDIVLKEPGKTYHMCPTFTGGRDWPSGAYNPKTNVMFIPLQNLYYDTTPARRPRSGAAVRLQRGQRTTYRTRQGQGRMHRRDRGRHRKDAVDLGDARLDVLADPRDSQRPRFQWRDGPLSARPRYR
jgi:glucose dehydrogenase